MRPSRLFPVDHGQYLWAVPWAFVEPHAAQCPRIFQQTLEELATPPGLDPCELLCVLHERAYPHEERAMEAAEATIITMLAAWLAQPENLPYAP